MVKEETVESKVNVFLDKIKKENKKINAVLSLNPNLIDEAKELDKKKKSGKKLGKLFGKVIGVKANICVYGMESNCASRTLEGWKSPFDATVIRKIRDEDGLILGILNMDEFACGVSGETSAYGKCDNPACPGKVPGGSSSGVAAAVRAGFCDLALGSDTGGSIRNPASNCGVIGVKPSYGLVSRYGLIDLSMSLDQIGPVGRNIEDVAVLLEVISGLDEKDATTFDSKEIKVDKPGKIKVGVLRLKGVDKKIQRLIDERTEEVCKRNGWKFSDVEIKHIDLAVQTYYVLVCCEFYSGTRKFDGRRYGFKIEDVCGEEVLRRILGGREITKAEFSGRYYNKSLDVKKFIKEEFERVFRGVDIVVSPVSPVLPWDLGNTLKMNPEELYAIDALTIPANLAEICGASVPVGKIDGIPVGMQVLAGKGKEGLLLGVCKEVLGRHN